VAQSAELQPAELRCQQMRAGIGWTLIASAALILAVFFAPFRLAAWPSGGYPDVSVLSESMSSGFVQFWASGSGVLNPQLADAIDFWARFHIVKALLAAALLAVLVPLGSATWRRYVRSDSLGRRLLLGVAGLTQAAFAFLALLILTANIQGAIAPWTSAMGLLPKASSDPALAVAIEGVSGDLAGGVSSPAADALLHDFVVYHAAMSVVGAATVIGLLAATFVVWRKRRATARADRRKRRVLASASFAFVSTAALFALVTAANISTVVHPVPALLGFYGGGL
jgi:hypothetical protein